MTVDELALESMTVRRVVAGLLRATIDDFNQSPISLSAVDRFREGVSKAADMLDPLTTPFVAQAGHSLRVVPE